MKTIINNTTPADRLLLLLLLVLSVSGIFISREAVSQPSDVIIEVNGKPEFTFPLNIDRTVSVSGPCGNTVIEIREGKVRVKEAHCPNQLCVKEGWISRGAIVCLPNKIVVLVGKGDARVKDLDGTTG